MFFPSHVKRAHVMAPYAHLSQLWPAALCLVDIASAASGHVHIPFSRPELDLGQDGSRTLSDFVVPYLIQVQVGAPPQRVSLLISSSMTDTWVPDATSSFCDNQYSASLFDYDEDYNSDDVQKCVWGSFNASQSSTYKNANARYADFDPLTFSGYALGINATDKLVISDLMVDNYPLGIVNSASSWIGVLGLGNNYSSSTIGAGYYATILDRMVSSGQISTPAYSIWLDDEEGISGSILFGAVDKSRYSGDLLRLNALNPHVSNDKFSTSVHSINFTRPDDGMLSTMISNDLPLDVIIGMGEIISFLPDDLASYMASLTGATLDITANLYTIPCTAGSWSNATILSFQLGGPGGPLLEVHTSDLIIRPGVFTGQLLDNLDPSDKERLNLGLQDDDTCVFGIQTWDTALTFYSGEGFYASSSYRTNKLYNLGNSFLRRSYMVFDVARWEIAVTPVVYKYPGLDQFSDVVDFADEYKAKTPGSQYYCSVDFEDYCPEDSINCPGGGWSCDNSSRTGGGSYDGGYPSSYNPVRFWRNISIALGTIFGVFVLIGLVTAGFLWARIIKKDRRTMGLPRDEEKRLMGDDGEERGDAVAGLKSQQQPIMTGAAAGPLPVIREEEPSAPALAQIPPVAANCEQRLSAPDMMGAPRSLRPLSDDGMGDARAEAASLVPVTKMDPKGKGKGVAEEIGQAR